MRRRRPFIDRRRTGKRKGRVRRPGEKSGESDNKGRIGKRCGLFQKEVPSLPLPSVLRGVDHRPNNQYVRW
jgi:hypothetical protein